MPQTPRLRCECVSRNPKSRSQGTAHADSAASGAKLRRLGGFEIGGRGDGGSFGVTVEVNYYNGLL